MSHTIINAGKARISTHPETGKSLQPPAEIADQAHQRPSPYDHSQESLMKSKLNDHVQSGNYVMMIQTSSSTMDYSKWNSIGSVF